MWNRVAIHCKTGLDDTILKVLLAKYSFYILSGPWGRLWCKFGYDPRKDPNAKRFQTIMVSFRKHQSIPERQRLRLGQGDRNATVSVTPVYQYTAGLLPVIRQMWYCVCDIRLPAAQRLLRSDFYGTLPEYNPTTGWLPAETIKAIRNAIKEDVRNTSNTLEAEEGSDAEEDALTERQSEDESGDLLNAMEWEDE
ncbi:hypothetical protein M3Y99_00178300 [Aphelenchoides fujianensis]|nr:hypothetical protein M3Y99_00178300 [Aphelenchoides fujianensis]